jgi:predicted dehydrogenase
MSNLSIGIVGLGYWGPNLVRNFRDNPHTEKVIACDLKEENRKKISDLYPDVTVTKQFDDLLQEADAVVIATPTSAHFSLAKQALEEGKHILIEKPFTSTSQEAQELIKNASEKNLTLMVDHTFIYSSPVRQMKQYIDDTFLGDLLYFDSVRTNLGKVQPDTNVLWDLAVHDLSILTYLFPDLECTELNAIGSKHYTDNEEDAHLHLQFANNFFAHIHVSWLSPIKERRMTIAGSKRMLVYNDNEPTEKIHVYDKGYDPPDYRDGEIIIPTLKPSEPLAELARHFIACIQGQEEPLTPGEDGLKVIKLLEQANHSLAHPSLLGRGSRGGF